VTLASKKCSISPLTLNVVLALALALTVFTLANPASAQSASGDDAQPTRPIHIVPMTGAEGNAAPLVGPHLSYYGGPVISNVHVVTVFWTNSVDSGVQTTMPLFYSAITNSTFYDLLSEYATNVTPVGGGSGTNQSIGRGNNGGTFTITPSRCSNGNPCTIDDTAIQSELLAQINGGHLPAPQLDNDGNVNTLYMIYFPPGVTITMDDGSQSCATFCAYHFTLVHNGQNVYYGVVPDLGGACASVCGSGSQFDNTTAASSHEMIEAVTDAAVGLATTYGPPLAWYDQANGEIGDICVGQDASVAGYNVQTEWSNSRNKCVAK